MNSLKTALSVVIIYIMICILGTAAIALLVMAYFGCLRFVVGADLVLYSGQSFLYGIKVAFPVMIIFSQMFMILFLLRHSKKNRLAGIITIFILTCVSYLVLVPIFVKHSNKLVSDSVVQKSKMSTGYFRLYDDGLYYFSKVESNNKADGIYIDVNQLAINADPFVVFKNLDTTNLDSSNFSDVLVKQLIEFPKSLDKSFSNLFELWKQAQKAYLGSIKSWLFFSSFGIALFFVFCVASISKWRLVNACYILVSTYLVIKLNMICYGICSFQKINEFTSKINLKLKSLGSIFSGIDFPICFVANIILVLIFFVLGLIFMLKNRAKFEDAD